MKCIYPMFFALFAATAPFAATVNLSTLTGNYTAQNGDVLTGTLEGKSQPYKISIADGAKVTLSDATINGSSSKDCPWAGLTCLGNCTVVLEGSNTVRGFYNEFPGIQAAKNEGKGDEYTLVIEGNGSLDAKSSGWGAGIGGGYSDFDCSFGKKNCGNIIIRGGIVTATGGSYAAGVGSGYEGTSGDIIITNDITKVMATKGIDAPYSINVGDEESASTITIW